MHLGTRQHGSTQWRAVALVLVCLTATLRASGAELHEQTIVAYDAYAERARQLFLDRVRTNWGTWAEGESTADTLRPESDLVARPAREDGVLDVPGGLVHHWVGTVFISDATLEQVLGISRAYGDYRTIYKPVVASTLLSQEGNTFHVSLRIREGAAGVSGILDIRSTVQYFYPSQHHAYALSTADEIREVRNAGWADERRLPAGVDSGYLWRASTLSCFIERDGGVYVEMETLGLSRRFPPLLGWLIEPIARRLGRKSVEASLDELRTAVHSRHLDGVARTRSLHSGGANSYAGSIVPRQYGK